MGTITLYKRSLNGIKPPSYASGYNKTSSFAEAGRGEDSLTITLSKQSLNEIKTPSYASGYKRQVFIARTLPTHSLSALAYNLAL